MVWYVWLYVHVWCVFLCDVYVWCVRVVCLWYVCVALHGMCVWRGMVYVVWCT